MEVREQGAAADLIRSIVGERGGEKIFPSGENVALFSCSVLAFLSGKLLPAQQ